MSQSSWSSITTADFKTDGWFNAPNIAGMRFSYINLCKGAYSAHRASYCEAVSNDVTLEVMRLFFVIHLNIVMSFLPRRERKCTRLMRV